MQAKTNNGHLERSRRYATSVKFRPGFPELASGSMDQTVRVWAYDAVTEAAPASPEVRDDATATSSAVQSEVLHEAAAPAPVPAPPAAILRLASPVHALAWSADGALLLAGGDRGAPAAWRATASGYDAMAPPAGQGHAAPVVQVAIAPDGTCCPRPSAGINPSVGPCRAAAAADEDDPRPRVPGPKFRRTRPLRAVRKEKYVLNTQAPPRRTTGPAGRGCWTATTESSRTSRPVLELAAGLLDAPSTAPL